MKCPQKVGQKTFGVQFRGDVGYLIINDMILPKTGCYIEQIGRRYSHSEHRSVLGFKAVVMRLYDREFSWLQCWWMKKYSISKQKLNELLRKH